MDDDVRDWRFLRGFLAGVQGVARTGYEGPGATPEEYADALVAEGFGRHPVRPHGTVPAEQVSDAEVEAALVSLDTDWVWPSHEAMRVALKAAREV